ncbi:neuroendocrine convertase 2 isoform X1 [Strongylocentrotus purpuratus]|uniref:Neuroendocrine convertase 2 n=1 Tax=Strongylocentrotus purpuratus TaxID=7668 RepID=A0A7M7REC6_STRPU|nr:neuroendocrine convertase 2 isoform X1 [Strongylocentrotus purpuratus]|eukprot:XP_784245.3 PREDICTED: neuroendocrine convertase 2 [Strongylocentrotus purpuratus]
MMFGDMTWRQGLCFGAFLMVAVVVCVEASDKHYTNSFVVEVQDGDSPHSLAKRHKLDYLGQVLKHQKNLHYFQKRSVDEEEPHSHRRRRSLDDATTQLEQDPMVKRVVQQEGYVRVKRGFKDLKQLYENFDLPEVKPHAEEPVKVWKDAPFNDPLLSKQWFIKNIGQADGRPGLDLNIEEAWKAGYTGKGVTIAIMDDGIDYLHPDIAPNFNANASYDFSSNDPLPYPRYTDDWFNSHGTRCAGEVSAVANNGVCGVGIAYNSKIAGIRMLDQPYMTDIIEASSMSHLPQEVDIYSASWGPQDNGKTVDGPRDFTLDAIANGVNNGRNGKGSIYVWASGDGGPMDDCNCDGYASSMWTVSINSAINDGRTALYDESCSSTLASTFSNGRKNRHPEAGVATTDLYGNCTLSHSGTSAAAPEAAGVFALALEANPDLTWRDIQHLTVLTSHKNQLYDENYDWQCNGVGLEFNHLFGFGVLDAGAMVKLAEKWDIAPERFHCTGAKWNGSSTVRAGDKLVLKLNTDACTGQKGHVRYLEHTQAIITINSSRRGDVTLNLTSPMGTRSILLSTRPQDDDNKDGFQHWPFMTTHTWGEDPRGEWTLEVAMVDGSEHAATLTEWSLVLHGTQSASYIEEANARSKCKVKVEQLAKEAEEAAHNQTIIDQREEEEVDQAMKEAMMKAQLKQEQQEEEQQQPAVEMQEDYPDEAEPSSDQYPYNGQGNGIYDSEVSSMFDDYSSSAPSYIQSWKRFGSDEKFLTLLKDLLTKEAED